MIFGGEKQFLFINFTTKKAAIFAFFSNFCLFLAQNDFKIHRKSSIQTIFNS